MSQKTLYAFLLASLIHGFVWAADLKVDLMHYLCPGLSITVSAVGMNSGEENTYLWSNGATSQTITINEAGFDYYSVEVTDPQGNKSTLGFWVVGIPEKLTVEIAGPTEIAEGETLTLEARTNMLDDETFSCLWTGPDGFTAKASTVTLADITEEKAGEYTVVATSPYGCRATATVKIDVIP